MRNAAFILSMLSVTAASWAQTEPPPASGRDDQRREQMTQKREQMKQRFEEHFKKADTNGDGALSKAEAEKGMPRLARDFDAIDANKDGKLTQDEIRTYMKAHMGEHRKEMHGQGKEMFQERFKKADTNGDGALSKAEAEKGMPRLAKEFDAIDANKDGKLTQDEIRAYMQARMQQHRQQGGGKAQ
jgi:Ca2+-binding EF-hand superfamily protein